MENKFYVYIYLDPREKGNFNYNNFHFDYRPIYIGKGCGYRIEDHLPKKNSNYRGCNPILFNKLNKIIKDGFAPIIQKISSQLTEKDAFDLEIKMISEIGKICDGKLLCNILNGGEGNSIPESVRKKMSKSQKERFKKSPGPMKGKHHTEKTKLKMSINHSSYWKGKHHKQSSKLIISIKNKRPKPKLCSIFRAIDPHGKEYIINDGLPKFCLEHSLNHGSMCAVANNKRNHHKGWKCYYIKKRQGH